MSLKTKFILKSNVVLILSLILLSCGKEEENKREIKVVSPDSAIKIERNLMVEKARKLIGENLPYTEFGDFIGDSTLSLIAGEEISTDSVWGIKFYLIKKSGKDTKIVYQTSLLNGSFNEASVSKIKLGNNNYEMIYYNSLDYFLGSGGGEIFSYIIDPVKKEVYYAHFFTVPKHPTSLYLSGNIINPEIRNFFISIFQKDNPGLKLVNKDYSLENIF